MLDAVEGNGRKSERRANMVRAGIGNVVHFFGCILKGAAWILIHALKLALAVLEIVLLSAGSVMKIFLLVLA